MKCKHVYYIYICVYCEQSMMMMIHLPRELRFLKILLRVRIIHLQTHNPHFKQKKGIKQNTHTCLHLILSHQFTLLMPCRGVRFKRGLPDPTQQKKNVGEIFNKISAKKQLNGSSSLIEVSDLNIINKKNVQNSSTI